MGRERDGEKGRRKGRKPYVRGPRWSEAQRAFVNRVIADALSHAPRISLADLYCKVCYYHQIRFGEIGIALPSRSTFYKYVRWLSTPDPRFQQLIRVGRRRYRFGTRILGHPDIGDAARERSIWKMDYKLLYVDGTVLLDSSAPAPAPDEPAPAKLYLPHLAIVEGVNTHYEGNILRIDNLWLAYTHPEGSVVGFPYTGHGTRRYYRDLGLN